MSVVSPMLPKFWLLYINPFKEPQYFTRKYLEISQVPCLTQVSCTPGGHHSGAWPLAHGGDAPESLARHFEVRMGPRLDGSQWFNIITHWSITVLVCQMAFALCIFVVPVSHPNAVLWKWKVSDMNEMSPVHLFHLGRISYKVWFKGTPAQYPLNNP